jgi:hypothetical protein
VAQVCGVITETSLTEDDARGLIGSTANSRRGATPIGGARSAPHGGETESRAGDRGRTGDVQVGKVNQPKAEDPDSQGKTE